MRPAQIFGLVALAVGIVLLIFAYNASNAPASQVTDKLTGHYTHQTMWYLIVGIAATLGGGLAAMFGRRF